MLPLGRRDLVFKGAGALAMAQARMWALCAIAGVIANAGLPIAEPLLISLVIQLPIFALLTVFLSLEKLTEQHLFMMITAMTAAGSPVWLTSHAISILVATSIASLPLLAISYRR